MRALFSDHRGWAWLLLLPLVLAVYPISFDDFPIIEQQHSVLGDADAANYFLLIREFSLTRSYGNPYTHTDEGRGVGENAQKHKLHHLLYLLAAAPVYWLLSFVYGLFGAEPRAAAWAVNAVVTCVNVWLLWLVMGRLGRNKNPAWPFALFYVAALSTWLFGSQPESWPFTGTLVLIFAYVRFRWSPAWYLQAALIGFFMLNNFTLIFLLAFLVVEGLHERLPLLRLTVRTFLSVVVVGTVWLVLLTLLSLFDPLFRPDQYAHYTLWYKDFTNPDLPFFKLYVWKSVLSELYISSVVSQQSDPFVPQESLLYTLKGGVLGPIAVASYLSLIGLAASRVVGYVRAEEDRAARIARILDDRGFHLVAFCIAWIFMTMFLYYPGGFLYSCAVLPVMTLLLYRFLDLGSLRDRAWLYAVLVVILANNVTQVLHFREILSGS